MPLPYRDGCPNCEASRAYWRSVDDAAKRTEEAAMRVGVPLQRVMVGITINAEDVPQCPEHLDD